MKDELVSAVVITRNRRKDLTDCVNSLLKSDYKNIEIIVIDNGSDEPINNWFKGKFPRVKLITSTKNLGAAGGRNLGIEYCSGTHILFMDDDAIAEAKMISSLVRILKKDKLTGIVQPIIYDKFQKKLLDGAGHDISLLTGRIKAWGAKEKDLGQYNFLREIPLSGCIWMVKKDVINKIGNYDERYFIPYEDSDFSFRAKKAGFKIYCVPQAIAWHKGRKSKFVNPYIELIGITSLERAFRISRNKLIYLSKNAPSFHFLFFFLLIQPLYLTAHSLIIIFSLRFDILIKYWQGVFAGWFWAFLIKTNLDKIL